MRPIVENSLWLFIILKPYFIYHYDVMIDDYYGIFSIYWFYWLVINDYI